MKTWCEEDFALAVALWREWNEKINVVSRKDIDNLYRHHIVHSLAISAYLDSIGESLDGCSVLDVGCGGGFPGVPLAMTNPSASFTLCDSIGKKIKVAQAVSEGLGLENINFVNARVETVHRTFDWVVSRAVTSLDEFYPWVKGKFSKGILYLKGGDVNEEISVLCRTASLDPSKISVWSLGNWTSDDYFKEKFVIHVRK